jgi:hypothetical protein
MVDKTKNQIDKALDAVNSALEIEPIGEEVQIDSKGVEFEGFEIMDDGSAEEIITNETIDQSQIPFDANLSEYISDDKLSKERLGRYLCQRP